MLDHKEESQRDELIDLFEKLQHKSETAKICYQYDWSSNGLGPVSTWPYALKTTVSNMMTTTFAMYVLWGKLQLIYGYIVSKIFIVQKGPDAICIYNDGYIGILGKKKHPCIGSKTSDLWSEIWNVVGKGSAKINKKFINLHLRSYAYGSLRNG